MGLSIDGLVDFAAQLFFKPFSRFKVELEVYGSIFLFFSFLCGGSRFPLVELPRAVFLIVLDSFITTRLVQLLLYSE